MPILTVRGSLGNAALRTTQRKTDHILRASPTYNLFWLALVVLIATASGVPFIRTMFVGIDEAVLLNGAERRIYADFFEFLPPGGFVLTAAWFCLAGISVGSARSLAILTIVGVACFTYLACRQASKNSPFSALLAALWVVMSQGIWTQVSHHWLTTLFSMVTAWATLTNSERPRPHWPLIAGIAAGTAAMTTTHRIYHTCWHGRVSVWSTAIISAITLICAWMCRSSYRFARVPSGTAFGRCRVQ